MKKLLSFFLAVIIILLSVFPAFSKEKDADNFLRGDVDFDNHITIIDATTIQKGVSGLITFSELQKALADVNGNGVVDIIDATFIQQFVALIIKSFSSAYEDTYVPEYFREHLNTKAEQINTTMNSLSENHCAFLWYNDAHWTYNSKSSPYLLRYLSRHTSINKTNFGGDIVDTEADITTAEGLKVMEYLNEWRSMIKDIPNHHSIIGNHDDGNATNNLFPDDYIYSFLLQPEENNDIVKGDGYYYYIDDEAEKTRYLYLDSAYKGATNEQLLFLENALLTAEEDYHFVVISHIWYDPDYDNYHIRPIPIAGLNKTALKFLSILDSYNLREGKFADCTGYVEFCIGGHAHIDYSGYSESGIPIFITESDCINSRGIYNSDLKTTNESSVNAIIADFDKRKINIIRVGRGEDKIIKY